MTRLKHIQNWPELARQAKWSASALAMLCGVTVRTLHRHFLHHTGKNTKTWLDEQRQHNAHELLCDGSSIKETAACLGYKSQSNFTRHYKHQTGICPSQQPPPSLLSPNFETSRKGREASEGTPSNFPASPSRPSHDTVLNLKCPQMNNVVRE